MSSEEKAVSPRTRLIVEIYKGITGKYRWRVKDANNHKNMANGSQGYKDKRDCIHGVQKVLGIRTPYMMYVMTLRDGMTTEITIRDLTKTGLEPEGNVDQASRGL